MTMALVFWVLGQMSDDVRQERVARGKELPGMIQAELDAIQAIQNGPCRCGAANHAACPTPDVCEPAEEAEMQAHRTKAEGLRKEYDGIRGTLAANKKAALARAAALPGEIAKREELREKLRAELVKVEKLNEGDKLQWKLEWGWKEYAQIADAVLSQSLSWFPQDEEARAILQGAYQAATEAAKAWGSEDPDRLQRSIKALSGAARAVAVLAAKNKDALPWISLVAAVTDASADLFAALTDRDPAKLKERLPVLFERLCSVVGQIPGGNWALGSRVLQTSYNVGSLAVMTWHVREQAASARDALQLQAQAEGLLRTRIDRLGRQIEFQRAELKKYEGK